MAEGPKKANEVPKRLPIEEFMKDWQNSKNKERISAYAEKTTVKHGTEKFKKARLVVKNKDKVFTLHGSSEDIMKAIENYEEEERRSQRRITNS